jgi:hypothetical protein
MRSCASLLSHLLLVMACAIATGAALGATACGKVEDFHQTAEVRSQPCVGCHRAAFVAATNPKHVGAMPETCNACHSTKQWAPATANEHGWFPLRNKHAAASCAQCHAKGYEKGATPRACNGCHQKDYDAARNPSHKGYSTECATCHTDAGWRPAAFNHPWPLLGKHATATCFACHVGEPPRYQGTPKDCVLCHQKDVDGARTPPHTGFPSTCSTCHTEQGWRPSTFAHPWPLDGAHASAPCAGCHKGNPPVYRGTPLDCVGCHLDDYQRATFPGHNTVPKTCESCHGKAAWKPAIGGAHPEASFPISTGPHSAAGVSCTSCHDPARGASTAGQNTDCIHCHVGAHNRPAIDAKHTGVAGYPGPNAPPNFCIGCHPRGRK